MKCAIIAIEGLDVMEGRSERYIGSESSGAPRFKYILQSSHASDEG